MPTFRVKISWTDGWHMETHEVEAETADAACQAAVEQAGESDDWFTAGEPGPTIVDGVDEVVGGGEVPHTVPPAYQDQGELGWRMADELTVLLREVTREVEDGLSVRTLTAVRDALAQARAARSAAQASFGLADD